MHVSYYQSIDIVLIYAYDIISTLKFDYQIKKKNLSHKNLWGYIKKLQKKKKKLQKKKKKMVGTPIFG